MSSYTLRGLIVPTAAQTGFGIPFFGCPDSNEIFVQDVGLDDIINRFLVFPGGYPTGHYNAPPRQLSPSHPAIFAFVLNGEAIWGARPELSSTIAELYRADRLPLFAAVDIAAFTGNRELFREAVERASGALNSSDRKRRWHASQVNRFAGHSSVQKVSPREMPEEDSLRWLTESGRDPRWGVEWLYHRSRFGRSEIADDLAIAWLDSGHWNQSSSGEILSIMLRSRERLEHASQIAVQWLYAAPSSHPHWARVWSRLPRSSVPEELRARVIEYLEDKSSSRSIGTWKIWIAVWKKAFATFTHLPELADLGLDALEVAPNRAEIVEQIIFRIQDITYFADIADAAVRNYVLSDEYYRKRWANIVAVYLTRHPDDEEVITKAERVLDHFDLPANFWASVWLAVRMTGRSPHLYGARGNDWARFSSNSTAAWARVVQALLEDGLFSRNLTGKLREVLERPQLPPARHRALLEAIEKFGKANPGQLQLEYIISPSELRPRTWKDEVNLCITIIGRQEFSLADLYEFEPQFSTLFPHNRNIKAKLRQQLQYIRDDGNLIFLGNGRYRLR